MNLSNPPREDEFEVSIIGPGRGECILIHLGYNEWCIADSCIGQGQGVPAAVQYLNELGSYHAEGVLLLLATHWHDDHIRGIASALQTFSNAKFACSAAIQTTQFIELVELQTKLLQGRSGVDEFGQILRVLLKRRAGNPTSSTASPIWALQDRLLLRRDGEGRKFQARITALSPSDETVKLAIKQIAQLIPTPNQPQRRITNRPPNKDSTVLLIEVGHRKALLGADLEHSGHPGEGWLAILNSAQTAGLADVFKIAHHGSPNADCPEVWEKLLEKEPIAILTPFTSGKGLPQQADLKRLMSRTPNLYCTGEPSVRLPKREKMVEKKLQTRRRVALDGKLGHVRLRWSATNIDAQPEIELFNGAFRVLPP
jgi:beta-lactamase superfamily II metal-dependent hydrolase